MHFRNAVLFQDSFVQRNTQWTVHLANGTGFLQKRFVEAERYTYCALFVISWTIEIALDSTCGLQEIESSTAMLYFRTLQCVYFHTCHSHSWSFMALFDALASSVFGSRRAALIGRLIWTPTVKPTPQCSSFWPTRHRLDWQIPGCIKVDYLNILYTIYDYVICVIIASCYIYLILCTDQNTLYGGFNNWSLGATGSSSHVMSSLV